MILMNTNINPAWLDAQYNNRALVPDFQKYLDRWKALSSKVRADQLCRLDTPYGAGGMAYGDPSFDLTKAMQQEAILGRPTRNKMWSSTGSMAYGDPSFTVRLFTVSGRSSFGNADAFAAATTPFTGKG